jgi:hypothetical protein
MRSDDILDVFHKMVLLGEAPTVKAVRAFAMDTGLGPWNRVEIDPSWGVEEGPRRLLRSRPSTGNSCGWGNRGSWSRHTEAV